MEAVGALRVRKGVLESYTDVLTAAALKGSSGIAPFDADRRALMRGAHRASCGRRQREHGAGISFLPADATIGRTTNK